MKRRRYCSLIRLARFEHQAMIMLGECDWCRWVALDAARHGTPPRWCRRCWRVPNAAAIAILAEAFGFRPVPAYRAIGQGRLYPSGPRRQRNIYGGVKQEKAVL